MQVESPDDVICAYATQVVWLARKLEKLKQARTLETDPVYIKVLGEWTGCQNALTKMKAILAEPKGHWVQVLKSKADGLQGRVGKVTYVNVKNKFASVLFSGDEKPRNLGLSNLVIISMPVPTMKVPCAGMRVTCKGDPVEYVSITWDPSRVYVEPTDVTWAAVEDIARQSKRVWKNRFDLETINGVPA